MADETLLLRLLLRGLEDALRRLRAGNAVGQDSLLLDRLVVDILDAAFFVWELAFEGLKDGDFPQLSPAEVAADDVLLVVLHPPEAIFEQGPNHD